MNDKHSWYPSLAVVDEIKSWGVQVYVFIPTVNGELGRVGRAYTTLTNGSFKVVGAAHLVATTPEGA